MTLDDTLLEKLASWRPAPGRQPFAVLDSDSQAAVQLTVDRLDELGCRLWEASVTRSPQAAAREPSLKAWAERVAARVTGLLEPLKLIEVDDNLGQALLRSDGPAAKGNDLFYYEVVLHRTGAAFVRRYRGSRLPTKREQVSFVLTREALAKLVKDLAAE
jgi:hypothetical protein